MKKIVPLANKASGKYFYVTKSNSTTIAEREWNNFNYVLLNDKDILSTRMSNYFVLYFNSTRESDTKSESKDEELLVDIATYNFDDISIIELLIIPSSVSNNVLERTDWNFLI